MPLTEQEYQNLGQAVAQQLKAALGGSPPQPVAQGALFTGTPARKSAEAIGAEYQTELVGLVKDLVSDLKEAGHLPAGRELTEAVIVIA